MIAWDCIGKVFLFHERREHVLFYSENGVGASTKIHFFLVLMFPRFT